MESPALRMHSKIDPLQILIPIVANPAGGSCDRRDDIYLLIAAECILRYSVFFRYFSVRPSEKLLNLIYPLHDFRYRRYQSAPAFGIKADLHFADVISTFTERLHNLFAAQVSLDDKDFLELAMQGYDTQQIARAMNSDINFVALKVDTLRSQGYELRPQEHRNDFLRYDR
jgi:hypothetical protein